MEDLKFYISADDPWQKLVLTIKRVYWSFWNSVLFSPWFYLGVPVCFIMEKVWPVQRGVPLVGTNARVDFLYLRVIIPFKVVWNKTVQQI